MSFVSITLHHDCRPLGMCCFSRNSLSWLTCSVHVMCRVAKLYITDNGQGSPCLDLQRVPAALANATVGADLVILEGMGRAIHTNLNASFSCPSLKLAMIKTHHLAQRLFNGKIYDCICIYSPGGDH